MTQQGPDQTTTGRAARGAVLTAAGLAGAASFVALATPAHAVPTAPAAHRPAAPDSEQSSSAPRRQAAITPVYGKQKYRVGVRGKAGDYFPPGTSTAGTTFRVTETPQEGQPTSFDCSSVANTGDAAKEVTLATFCPGENEDLVRQTRRQLKAVNEPTDGNASNSYVAPAGATITVTQQTVRKGLVIDSSTATLPPCEVDADSFDNWCGVSLSEGDFDTTATSTDLVFEDAGIPPVAKDDEATTRQDTAVTIDIQGNDDPNAKITGVKISTEPGHGTAALGITDDDPVTGPSSGSSSGTSSAPATTDVPSPVLSLPSLPLIAQSRHLAGARTLAAVGSYQAIYTPAEGFVGTDHFSYTITTKNGTATAEVTVRVSAVASGSSASASASASRSVDASTDRRDPRDPIAQTGTDSGELLTYGLGLVVAGGAAVALGTRRRRGRHAR